MKNRENSNNKNIEMIENTINWSLFPQGLLKLLATEKSQRDQEG
jgi:hypothetical protein